MGGLDDYKIVCDQTNNNKEDIDQSKLNVDFSAPFYSPTGEAIRKMRFLRELGELCTKYQIGLGTSSINEIVLSISKHPCEIKVEEFSDSNFTYLDFKHILRAVLTKKEQ